MSAPVAVLLPVRIETAFDPHPAGCRLRVVVIPDAPWVDKHDETVQPEELDALDAAWNAANGDFLTAVGELAFERLALSYGGARAAWLARSFPAVAVGGGYAVDRSGAVLREVARANAIRDLPREIELWATLASSPTTRVLLATLRPSGKALRIELGTATASDDADEELFRPSWEAAKNAGLAADLELADVGLDPADIGVLYAIGLGEANPANLFGAHRNAGLLGILSTGMPTNTVAGAPAADMAREPASWRRTLGAAPLTGEEAQLSRTLTGKVDAVGPLPAPERSTADEPLPPTPRPVLNHHERNGIMMRVLWPAFWSANLKDIWGLDAADPDVVHRLGRWAERFLNPEGPLPPIRIGNQPYGVLPVTSLRRWDRTGDPYDVERPLVDHLLKVIPFWAKRAEANGSIVDADTDKVLELLGRTPVTSHLMQTLHVPLQVVQLGLGSAVDVAKIEDWWKKQAEMPRDLRGGEPNRTFVQFLEQMDIDLPLVEPTKPQQDAEWLHTRGRSLFARALHWYAKTFRPKLDPTVFRLLRGEQPRSLLFRLIVHASVVAVSEIRRTTNGLRGPVATTEPRLSIRFGEGATPGELVPAPVGEIFDELWRYLHALADEDPRILERTFLATVDAASHRVDTWATGIAWRRMSEATYQDARRIVGLYGWVDSPFRGERGPTPCGLVLAPSAAQARTAVILRDKAVYDPAPAAGALPGTRRWDLTLDSARVRLADFIASQVRIGAHLGEVLGREVERICATKKSIDVLRDRYRLHSANRGRRVCDGQQIIARTPAQLMAETGIVLTPQMQSALEELRSAVDAYGDLLVADAVFDVVSGRGETAQASMDAAAGLELPPQLDVIRTPRQGRAVTSVLLAALPVGEAAAGGGSPVALAESSFAAQVLARFPAPSQWEWTREDRVTNAAGAIEVKTQNVTLHHLGLERLDALVLEPEQLAGLIVAHTHSAHDLQPSIRTSGSGPKLHAQMRRLMATFQGRPTLASDLGRENDESRADAAAAADAMRADDEAVRVELWARYSAVYLAASNLKADLDAALAGDELAMQTALREAIRWGIAPTAPGASDDPIERLRERTQKASDILVARLKRAPSNAAAPGALSAQQIASALSELATGGGRLPIFSRVRVEKISRTPLTQDAFEPMPLAGNAGAGRNALDRSWLQTLAAVRPSAARIESYQFEAVLSASPALRAWSNRPGDLWQQNPPPAEGRCALIVAYAPAGTLSVAGPTEVALVTLDAWSEIIPSQRHAVTSAFGFNAPTSRAPQSILVAVTPVDGTDLDTAALLDIVEETRGLAHGRMATPLDLRPLAAALPLTLVPTFYSDIAGLELAAWERTLT
jgi:hypothetical protein